MNKIEKEKNFTLGVRFIQFGFYGPFLGTAAMFISLPTFWTWVVNIIGIAGPEVILAIGVKLAGKKGVFHVKDQIKKLFGLPPGRYTASKTQYNIALFIIFILLSFIAAVGYIRELYEHPFINDNLIWISLTGDLLFVISICYIGGDQMIAKFSSLIRWEKWEAREKETA